MQANSATINGSGPNGRGACLEVDVLNYPIYIYHEIDKELIISFSKEIKHQEMKYLQCLKHRNMIHK